MQRNGRSCSLTSTGHLSAVRNLKKNYLSLTNKNNKMTAIKKLNVLVLAMLLMLVSCRDDIVETTTTTTRPDPTIIEGYNPSFKGIDGSLIGRVVDENNEGIANADVTMDGLTTLSNEYGHFFFDNVEMNAEGSFVLVEKDGHFRSSRRFYPKENSTSRINIEMMKKSFSKSFNTVSGGLISVEEGGSVDFPADAIVDANDEVYSGQVLVAARWLDPSILRTLDRMPGDLTGVNELNDEVALGTYGMMAVELESPDGTPLNVAPGSQATMTFPVPSELLGSAPDEIPLWYFNEKYGIWAQEGKAVLQGNSYVGGVNHFSFWNCDVPFDFITLDLTLQDDNGNALSDHLVSLQVTNSSGVNSASGYTDMSGYVSGKVPANEMFTLNIYSNFQCADLIYSDQIGPYSMDESLGTITLPPVGGVVSTTVNGSLLDCDGNAVTDGLVIVEADGNSEYFYTDGTPFSITATSCPDITSLNVTGIDFNNPGHTSENIVTAGIVNELNDVSVCNSAGPENTITVTVDGVTFVYSNATADIGPVDSLGTSITSDLGPDKSCSFYIATIGTTGPVDVYFSHIKNDDLGWALPTAVNLNEPFNITEFGANPGEKIIGSYSGLMWQQNTQVNVTIDFDLTRE